MRLDWKNWLRSLSSLSSLNSGPPSDRFPRRRAVILVCGLLAVVLVIGAPFWIRASHRPELRLAGLPTDGRVNAEVLRKGQFAVTAADDGNPDGTQVTLDGKPLRAHTDGRALSVKLGTLKDGEYELRVMKPGTLLTEATEVVRRLKVDTTAPRIEVRVGSNRSSWSGRW